MNEIRQRKLEEELRDIIAQLILSGDLKDPRVGVFISITRVKVAKDVSSALVFVSTFGETLADSTPEAKLDQAIKGLTSAAGFIQSQLGKRLRTRLTPKLKFLPDTGIKDSMDLLAKLDNLFH